MSGSPFHIHLEDNPTKYVAHTPVPVPHYYKTEVNEQLADDVKKGVIVKVPPGHAVDWCQRMLVLPKRDGTPRRVVDFQPLNKFVKRETHLSPTPFEAVSSIPPCMYKTKTDAYNGYHQILLDLESQKLTTFLTENGRYQYLRAPQGLTSSGDAYVHRYDDIIQTVERKVKIMDDALLYDKGIEEAFFHAFDYLHLCAENGVTLNPKKFVFCRKELDFCGFHLLFDGYRPSDDTISSIRDFPMPEQPTITDIKAWYGLVNHVAPFLITTELMKPFRELLSSTSKKVYWDGYLQSAFDRSKSEICKLIEIGLTSFRKERETALITDYSDDGLGFVLVQKSCQCDLTDPFCCNDGWKLILCGSRTLEKPEENYAPREGEALAVSWSMNKCKMFLLGHPGFMVFTDHKSLVKTFNDQELRKIDNPRILKMKEKCLMYRFVTGHIEGKKNCAPDILSRYPLKVCRSDVSDEDEADLMEREVSVQAVICGIFGEKDIIAVDVNELLRVAMVDSTYTKLIMKIKNKSFCKTAAMEDPELRPYFNIRDRLNICDNLIMYTYEDHIPRLLIPSKLRLGVLRNLHAAHQGLSTAMSRVRQTVYWPGIEKELQNEMSNCKHCIENAKSQTKEPLITSPIPEYPMQQVVSDLFEHDGHWYLVYADRLTGWPELAFFPTSTKSSVILATLREFFHRWGVPEELSLDGASNLSSAEFKAFLQRWCVHKRLSAAHYPQSNGRAEAAVKSMKRLIKGHTGPGGSITTDEIALGLLQYRNTPIDGGKSPAQLALGRELRDGIPLQRYRYRISHHWKQFLKQREYQMAISSEKQADRYNKSARPLQEIQNGVDVVCQNPQTKKWDRGGKVVDCLPHRQYKVRLDGSGRITLRNRRHIRQVYRGVPTIPQTSGPPPISEASGASIEPSQASPSLLERTSNSNTARSHIATSAHGSSTESSDSVPIVPRESRQRYQRKVYDPTTGTFKEPCAVPEGI